MEPKATRMPDGVYVFDEQVYASFSSWTSDYHTIKVEGFYYNRLGCKCYLFQFEEGNDEMIKEYRDTNGIVSTAVRFTD